MSAICLVYTKVGPILAKKPNVYTHATSHIYLYLYLYLYLYPYLYPYLYLNYAYTGNDTYITI